jgi:alanyl-tRNA synthetase
MQQHTGQHLLSAAFHRLAGARTVGFHLGSVSSTIDLAREVSPRVAEEAEGEANRVVWEDRPVLVKFEQAERASKLALRKESSRTGQLRLVEVEGFDLSACGGTHVARTGSIGMVVVLSLEKFRGGTRVEFACGRRALLFHKLYRDSVAGSIRHLSVLPLEMPAAIERLQAEVKELKRSLRGAHEKLAAHEAATMADRGIRVGNAVIVVEILENSDASTLKSAALAIIERSRHAVALLSPGPPILAVVGRSADLERIDAAAVFKGLVQQFGGKGGGRPDLAQGGGLKGRAADVAEAARELLFAQLGSGAL